MVGLAALAAGAAACVPDGAAAVRGAATWTWSPPDAIPASAVLGENGHRVAAFEAGPDGRLAAVFLEDGDGDGLADRVFFASGDAAGRWTAPRPIDGDGRGMVIAAPRLAWSADGRLHAFWLRGSAKPGEAVRYSSVVEREESGGAWSPQRTVWEDADGFEQPALAAASSAGALHLVFPGARGEYLHLRGSPRGWVADTAGSAGMEPRLVPGPGGALALVDLAPTPDPLGTWRGARLNDPQIRVWRDGRWSARVPISVAPAQASHAPQVVWDGEGGLVAAWLEAPPGTLLPTTLLVSRSRNGVLWSDPQPVGGDAPGLYLYTPRLARDASGAVHLTFARFRAGLSAPRHFHAVLAAGRWSPGGEILPGAGPRHSELESAVAADGSLRVMWEGAHGRYLVARASSEPDLEKQRVSRGGAEERGGRGERLRGSPSTSPP
jgi:hypothetical protein